MPVQFPRRALLAALLLAPVTALAAGKGGEAEFFAKLPTIVVEFWDANGLFHVVNMELTVVFPTQAASINKKVTERIAANLSAMQWEEFTKGNPAATIKAVALDTLRKDPTTDKAIEVLVGKLLLR